MDRPDEPTRRAFFQTSAVGTGALALPLVANSAMAADAPAPPAANSPDFTTKSAALEADEVVTSACQFCNSLCGLKVHLKAGPVIDITGEAADPVQAGELCVKGPMMAQLLYNRFRLTKPLTRVGGAKGDPASRF